MANPDGLGDTNITIALTNDLEGRITVQSSINLTDLTDLGPTTPRYE